MTAGTSTSVSVEQINAAGAQISASLTKKVEFTLSGPGSLNTDPTVAGVTSNYVIKDALVATPLQSVTVYADGRGGPSTLTVKVDGKTVGAKTIHFYGKIAKVELTQNKSIAEAGLDAAAYNTFGALCAAVPAFEAVAKDADGVVVPAPTWSVVSDNPSAILPSGGAEDDGTCSTSGSWSTPVGWVPTSVSKSGDAATFTFTGINASDGSTASATAKVTLGGDIKTVTLSLDKATYMPGEKAVLTTTAKDASGNPVFDGAHPLYSLVSNMNNGGALPTSASYTTGGKKTSTIYAPASSGSWMLNGYDANLAAISVSATVSSAADIAAAQAAIGALQTSVASLQTTVASLVASLTAQIKVINSALAKIAKKMKVKL